MAQSQTPRINPITTPTTAGTISFSGSISLGVPLTIVAGSVAGNAVTVSGYAPMQPVITAPGAVVGAVQWNTTTGAYSCVVSSLPSGTTTITATSGTESVSAQVAGTQWSRSATATPNAVGKARRASYAIPNKIGVQRRSAATILRQSVVLRATATYGIDSGTATVMVLVDGLERTIRRSGRATPNAKATVSRAAVVQPQVNASTRRSTATTPQAILVGTSRRSAATDLGKQIMLRATAIYNGVSSASIKQQVTIAGVAETSRRSGNVTPALAVGELRSADTTGQARRRSRRSAQTEPHVPMGVSSRAAASQPLGILVPRRSAVALSQSVSSDRRSGSAQGAATITARRTAATAPAQEKTVKRSANVAPLVPAATAATERRGGVALPMLITSRRSAATEPVQVTARRSTKSTPQAQGSASRAETVQPAAKDVARRAGGVAAQVVKKSRRSGRANPGGPDPISGTDRRAAISGDLQKQKKVLAPIHVHLSSDSEITVELDTSPSYVINLELVEDE